MNTARALLAAVTLALGLTLALSGCARGTGDETVSDEATMAILGTVRTLHHEADIFEAAGDHERAAGAVRRILALDFPRGMQEAEDCRTDAWGRLAELSLRAGTPDQAIAQANTGIADSHRESVLRARLYMVRGQALGDLAERATAVGDLAGATARRTEALQSLESSIDINQHVLGRLTDAGTR